MIPRVRRLQKLNHMSSYEQKNMVKWDIKKKQPKNGVFKANYELQNY